jgi:membrane associated rhomboid family serine protease
MPRARSFSTRSSISGYFPPGVKWLLIINTVIFLVCYLAGFSFQRHVSVLFALSAEAAVRTFMVWQVFTYMFVHYAPMHLLFNMLALWMFGVPLEQSWGTRRFLKFYFQCGLAAGVCVLVANMLVGDWLIPTLGASGAVFGLLVAFGIVFPDAIMLLFFLFPMRAKYAVMIYVAVELVITFGPNTGVSTIAHLGGAAYSYVYLKGRIPMVKMSLPDVRGAYRQWKLQRAKKKFQVYMRKHGGGGPFVN